MIKHNQNGFGLLEGLVVILILTIASFGGYYVWHSNQNKAKTPNSSEQTKTVKSNDETDSWLLFTSASNTYSMRLPDGYKFIHGLDNDFLIIGQENYENNMTYKPGTLAVVTKINKLMETQGCCTVLPVLDLSYRDNKIDDPSQGGYLTRVGIFTTKKGLNGTKYYVKETRGLNPGFERFVYYLESEGKSLQLSYDQQIGGTDHIQILEKAIKTLEFK